jgi:hypothetical protein
MNTWPDEDAMPSSISNTPAILALNRGDASAIRFVSFVLILFLRPSVCS